MTRNVVRVQGGGRGIGFLQMNRCCRQPRLDALPIARRAAIFLVQHYERRSPGAPTVLRDFSSCYATSCSVTLSTGAHSVQGLGIDWRYKRGRILLRHIAPATSF